MWVRHPRAWQPQPLNRARATGSASALGVSSVYGHGKGERQIAGSLRLLAVLTKIDSTPTGAIA